MTILRAAEQRALSHIRLDGTVLDLGGERGNEYVQMFPGEHVFTYANLSDKQALEKILQENGCVDINVRSLGSGVFAARAALVERLLPRFCSVAMHPCAIIADTLWTASAHFLRRKYQSSDYVVGLVATAKKL